MYEGHIKLFRRLRKAPYYQDSQYVHVWVHLLMSVNWTEKRLKLKNSDRFIDLLPGQILTSRIVLSKETGIHRSKLERILKALESEHQIEQQTFSKYRVISICKWDEYQHCEHQNEQQMSNKRATDEQQMSTKKKVKKEKNKPLEHFDNAREIFEKCWNTYPRKEGRIEAEKHFTASVKTKEEARQLFTAIQRYKELVSGREMQHIKQGSSFFYNWRDYATDTDFQETTV